MKLIKLQPDKDQAGQIALLMELFHEKTASKAVIRAATGYIRLKEHMNEYKEIGNRLRELLRDLAYQEDEIKQLESDLKTAQADRKKLLARIRKEFN